MNFLFHQIQNPQQLHHHRMTRVPLWYSEVHCLENVDNSQVYTCNDHQHRFVEWPRQKVRRDSLERHHRQHHILEQNKRLSRIIGCCCGHVIWEQLGIRWGFVWTWTWWVRHRLRSWKITLEREKAHKSMCSPPLREKSLIPLKDVDCVHNIHNRNSHPFATNRRPDKGLNQTMLRVQSEVHVFLISAHLCTVPTLPSLMVPEPSTIMFSQTNCFNPCI